MNTFKIGLGVLLLTISTHACIQRYGTKLDGSYNRSKASVPMHMINRITEAEPQDYWVKEEVRTRDEALKSDDNYKVKSDYAAALMHLGRAKEAVQILEPLARQHPREYNLIANLGTAYELDGQLEKALEHIRRGIDINPNSHDGTEWLHVKIIEARIALAKDPNWLKTHSVSGVSFGNKMLPEKPSDYKVAQDKYDELSEALIYQLHERLQFVQPPNAVVADLLFDLANHYAVTDVVETAEPIYKLALKYDDGSKPLIAERAAGIHSIAHGFNLQRIMQNHPVMVFLAASGTAVGLFVASRLRKAA